MSVFQPFPKQACVFTCLQYKSFENTVGKGEILTSNSSFSPTVFYPLENFPPFFSNSKLLFAGYQHFLLFPQCFQNAFYTGSLKVRIVWLRVPQCNIKLQSVSFFTNPEKGGLYNHLRCL